MRVQTVCGVLLLVLAAVGCGSGDDTEQPATTAAPTTEPQSSPTPTPTPEPAPATETTTEPTAQPDAQASGGTYVVESGDTLSSIAQRFDTTVDAIVEANEIENPDVIAVGEELTIPESS